MKKYTSASHGLRGSLPPQLFKYVDSNDIGAATRKFTDFITDIAHQFHMQLPHDMSFNVLSSIKLDSPKIFGQDTSLEYIGTGTMGSVYKLNIGEYSFALKLNRAPRIMADDLSSMHIGRRARGLVNKTYIGSTFYFKGEEYTWLLSDYISEDRANSFDIAREKLFYAYLTKGLECPDFSPLNVKDGKIIDVDSVRRRWTDIVKLKRVETDFVKKIIFLMKIDDKIAFDKLLSRVSRQYPNVIKYLYIYMQLSSYNMPKQLKKYLESIRLINEQLKQQNIYDTKIDR